MQEIIHSLYRLYHKFAVFGKKERQYDDPLPVKGLKHPETAEILPVDSLHLLKGNKVVSLSEFRKDIEDAIEKVNKKLNADFHEDLLNHLYLNREILNVSKQQLIDLNNSTEDLDLRAQIAKLIPDLEASLKDQDDLIKYKEIMQKLETFSSLNSEEFDLNIIRSAVKNSLKGKKELIPDIQKTHAHYADHPYAEFNESLYKIFERMQTFLHKHGVLLDTARPHDVPGLTENSSLPTAKLIEYSKYLLAGRKFDIRSFNGELKIDTNQKESLPLSTYVGAFTSFYPTKKADLKSSDSSLHNVHILESGTQHDSKLKRRHLPLHTPLSPFSLMDITQQNGKLTLNQNIHGDSKSPEGKEIKGISPSGHGLNLYVNLGQTADSLNKVFENPGVDFKPAKDKDRLYLGKNLYVTFDKEGQPISLISGSGEKRTEHPLTEKEKQDLYGYDVKTSETQTKRVPGIQDLLNRLRFTKDSYTENQSLIFTNKDIILSNLDILRSSLFEIVTVLTKSFVFGSFSGKNNKRLGKINDKFRELVGPLNHVLEINTSEIGSIADFNKVISELDQYIKIGNKLNDKGLLKRIPEIIEHPEEEKTLEIPEELKKDFTQFSTFYSKLRKVSIDVNLLKKTVQEIQKEIHFKPGHTTHLKDEAKNAEKLLRVWPKETSHPENPLIDIPVKAVKEFKKTQYGIGLFILNFIENELMHKGYKEFTSVPNKPMTITERGVIKHPDNLLEILLENKGFLSVLVQEYKDLYKLWFSSKDPEEKDTLKQSLDKANERVNKILEKAKKELDVSEYQKEIKEMQKETEKEIKLNQFDSDSGEGTETELESDQDDSSQVIAP